MSTCTSNFLLWYRLAESAEWSHKQQKYNMKAMYRIPDKLIWAANQTKLRISVLAMCFKHQPPTW